MVSGEHSFICRICIGLHADDLPGEELQIQLPANFTFILNAGSALLQKPNICIHVLTEEVVIYEVYIIEHTQQEIYNSAPNTLGLAGTEGARTECRLGNRSEREPLSVHTRRSVSVVPSVLEKTDVVSLAKAVARYARALNSIRKTFGHKVLSGLYLVTTAGKLVDLPSGKRAVQVGVDEVVLTLQSRHRDSILSLSRLQGLLRLFGLLESSQLSLLLLKLDLAVKLGNSSINLSLLHVDMCCWGGHSLLLRTHDRAVPHFTVTSAAMACP